MIAPLVALPEITRVMFCGLFVKLGLYARMLMKLKVRLVNLLFKG